MPGLALNALVVIRERCLLAVRRANAQTVPRVAPRSVGTALASRRLLVDCLNREQIMARNTGAKAATARERSWMGPNERAYNDFLDSIDNRAAGKRDGMYDLRFHIAGSAEDNANDMQQEGTAEKTNEGFYKAALSTAQLVHDAWKSHFPHLIKGKKR